jgi:hypothetical protein
VVAITLIRSINIDKVARADAGAVRIGRASWTLVALTVDHVLLGWTVAEVIVFIIHPTIITNAGLIIVYRIVWARHTHSIHHNCFVSALAVVDGAVPFRPASTCTSCAVEQLTAWTLNTLLSYFIIRKVIKTSIAE